LFLFFAIISPSFGSTDSEYVVFGGGEAKNEFLNRIYQNLVAHVINLVTFKLFYAQIRQNLKLFEAEFWEFFEPSFGAASWGLLSLAPSLSPQCLPLRHSAPYRFLFLSMRRLKSLY
jgi:hypothetical protein